MVEKNKIIRWGNRGKVLVFLHYFGGSALSWQWVAEMLLDNYQCIVINLPGFGGVPPLKEPSIQNFAAYVQEELNSLGIETYALIGHSMGGKIAMQMAANDTKGSIQQLILIAPSPPATEPIRAEDKEHMLYHFDRLEAEKSVHNITKQALPEDQYALAVETQLMSDRTSWKWWLLDNFNLYLKMQ